MTERRSALVIGGAGGIGGAVCGRLARDGLQVCVADRDIGRAIATREQLHGEGHFAEQIDVMEEASIEATLDRVETRAPYAVIVVVAGGPMSPPDSANSLVDMSLTQWEDTLRLNMTGTFLCVRKFARQRFASPLANGRIVTFSSITGIRGGGALGAAYPAAKAGISGFTRHAAMELAELGITANTVAPGSVDTLDFRRYANDAVRERVARNIPVQRIGTPDEIAAAVSFLVGEEASFVTGVTLDVNGGAVLR